jgi:fructose-1,6-bisphosphatase I
VAGTDVLGMAGATNVQGEDQKKLDLIANEVFKNVLLRSGQCSIMVSGVETRFISNGAECTWIPCK